MVCLAKHILIIWPKYICTVLKCSNLECQKSRNVLLYVSTKPFVCLHLWVRLKGLQDHLCHSNISAIAHVCCTICSHGRSLVEPLNVVHHGNCRGFGSLRLFSSLVRWMQTGSIALGQSICTSKIQLLSFSMQPRLLTSTLSLLPSLSSDK